MNEQEAQDRNSIIESDLPQETVERIMDVSAYTHKFLNATKSDLNEQGSNFLSIIH